MSGHTNRYGKRQSDCSDNAGSKRPNPGEQSDPFAIGPEDTVYRYLCPGRKAGSIIGRGGEIAKQLRADTHAKIRISESVPGCDERVITIFSTSREINSLEDAYDYVCPAQDALFRIHERLLTDWAAEDEENEESARVTVRLLVPPDQTGCIIGRGGQVIQGIRSGTGAQLRILRNERLPACAMGFDELLQISGDTIAVKKALLRVSSCLHANPSRFQHLLASDPPQMYNSGEQSGAPSSGTPAMAPVVSTYGGYKGERAGDWRASVPPRRDENCAKEFSLHLLCPSANIGGVIGKGGVTINQIRQESGASIKVDSSAAEDDCIIMVSAKELLEDPVSPTIVAAVSLQPICSEKTEPEFGEPSYTTRILVPGSRIGCLIGKRGSIINEMRRNTRANIQIVSKENIPKVAPEDDEMVQITAEIDVARNALIQIATQLKANFFQGRGALSAFRPVPYHPLPSSGSDGARYASREDKLHGRGNSYSGGHHGSGDMQSSETYGSHRDSQGGHSRYGGTYGGYSGRSSSTLSGPNPDSPEKYHGY